VYDVAIESVDPSELNIKGWMSSLAQLVADAFVLLRRSAAEELQRDVPGFWRGPA
jgi:hypothetical protein